jgi:hypothetical protein
LRYADRVPPEALRPVAVIRSLQQYVDFGHLTPEDRPGPAAQQLAGGLRKGMLIQDADAALGAPTSSAERKEGSLRVTQRRYSSPTGQVTAEFVEGVLVRYSLTSE